MYVDPFDPPWWWRKWIWGIRADIWIKNGGISEKLIKAGQATRIDPQSLPPVGDIGGGITPVAQAEKPKAPALLKINKQPETQANLNQVLGEVLELVRHKADNEHIALLERFQSDLPMVQGDASGLRQVFLNLTMNAIQSIAGPGQVEIATFTQDGMVTATITDNGCGITPMNLERIWDPFFTTKGVGNGVGLGLALSYNIIKKHDGVIDVDSTQGKGSKFTVRLPVCHA